MNTCSISSSSQSSSSSPSSKKSSTRTLNTTDVPSGGGAYHNSNLLLLHDTFDDACDAGQFFLNPCWYLYTRLEKILCDAAVLRRRRKIKHDHEHASNNEAASEEEDKALNNAAERTRKTKFQSTIQQSIYLICFYVVWAVVYTYIYPAIRANAHISNVHTIIGNILFASSMISYIAAKLSNPGNTTAETMSRFDNYPNDNVLYYMANNTTGSSDDTADTTTTTTNICPTLGIRKLARSKYDRFSQTHVPRFDHYCGWLGKSIGEENYRFFLAFVLLHTMLSTYGTLVLCVLLWSSSSSSSNTTEDGSSNHAAAVATMTGIIAMISAMFSCLTVIHSTFHIRLVIRGQSTNEHYKWKQLLLLDAAACNNNHGSQQQQHPATASATTPISNLEDMEGCHALPPQPGYLLSSSSLSLKRAQQQSFYNLGIAGNIYEVLFPRSLRSDAGFKKDS
jgi:DHHC palmitoyltransferase